MALKFAAMLLPPILSPEAGGSFRTRSPMTVFLPRHWPQWLLLLLSVLLIVAPASTKVAGTAWLLIVLVGLWATVCLPLAPPSSPALVQSSRLWVGACLLALALQAVATFYWADPWGDRHVEFRLLLGAVATFAIVRRLYVLPRHKFWLAHSLALACCVALSVVYVNGRSTPSNAIPWAAGVSFFVCLLLPLSFQSQIKPWQRAAWTLAALSGVAAVLLSQSRGSYGLVLWVFFVFGVVAVKEVLQYRKPIVKGWVNKGVLRLGCAAMATTLLVLAVLVSFPRIYEEPSARLQDAWSDVKAISLPTHLQPQGVNTSVGARLYMWRMALNEISEAPLIGHGSKARMAWIHKLGTSAGSDGIKSLDHLHSDVLTTLFDHGLLGLLSYLTLAAALIFIALRHEHRHTILPWSLSGILWMHLSAGLTNMNFGHNYYGVMLALSLALAWMLSTDEKKQFGPGEHDVSVPIQC